MCSPPLVVDMYIHPLRGKLDQGFSRPRMKTVRGVGDKIEASQGNKAHCLTKIFLSSLQASLFLQFGTSISSKTATSLISSEAGAEQGLR